MPVPRGGGHLWVYLNWALGLHAVGCDVTWLEAADASAPIGQTSRAYGYGRVTS